MYLQDDRDLRAERSTQEDGEGVRLHAPRAHFRRRADAGSNGSRSTASRATTATARCGSPRGRPIQLHGVIKSNLKATLKAIDDALLNTIAACGDVNRNVMCNPNPYPVAGARRGAGAGARDLRPSDAAHARLSRDLARRRAHRRRRGRGRRADLRQDLSAAEVQDRGRGAAVERRRRVRARSRLHRHRSTTTATSPAGTSPPAAAWA